jgi:hypothetical protein
MGRKSASGSGMRDEQPRSYFLELRNHFLVFLGLKYLNSLMRIRDPGGRQFGSGIRDGKKSDPGSGINIPDPQHWLNLFVFSKYMKFNTEAKALKKIMLVSISNDAHQRLINRIK